MNIVLSGYGKMGHEVETAARARKHTIVGTYDIDRPISLESLKADKPDVIIDFTQPGSVAANVSAASKAKIPIVIGTTGWEKQLSAVGTMIAEAKTGCVYASNFSIGVNLFLKIVADASHLLSNADYDVYISEAHHNMKKDFPSGTALRISEAVLSGFKSKTTVASELKQGEAPSKDTLLISSIRAGSITGTHTVGYVSDVDDIELTHRAKSRRGFALGAVRAAEWIVGKNGIYRFEDHITEILGV
ncbi:MAG TPA: 4-hydroxy-tetrahydrodipicolinate reductase [Candidatus Kapabacteria bacterium]|nr:4-hydroxy-tetrahydrodipicolinate reductase [Candidatus Kapabacteria bacterium]